MQHEINDRVYKINNEYMYCLDNYIDVESFSKIYDTLANTVRSCDNYYEVVKPKIQDQLYDDSNSNNIFKLTLIFNNQELDANIHFPELNKWIECSGIFDRINRIIFYINPIGCKTKTHYDYAEGNNNIHKDHFLWIDFLQEKKLFVLDEKFNKQYGNGKFLLFRTNNWHGCEPTTSNCFSLRIDGSFSESFLNKANLKYHHE